MLCTFTKGCKVDEHKHGEYDEMQTSQGFGQSLVVSGQTAEAVEPSEAALDHPAAGQQHESLFRLRQFDYLKLDSFVECSLGGLLACISLL